MPKEYPFTLIYWMKRIMNFNAVLFDVIIHGCTCRFHYHREAGIVISSCIQWLKTEVNQHSCGIKTHIDRLHGTEWNASISSCVILGAFWSLLIHPWVLSSVLLYKAVEVVLYDENSINESQRGTVGSLLIISAYSIGSLKETKYRIVKSMHRD